MTRDISTGTSRGHRNTHASWVTQEGGRPSLKLRKLLANNASQSDGLRGSRIRKCRQRILDEQQEGSFLRFLLLVARLRKPELGNTGRYLSRAELFGNIFLCFGIVRFLNFCGKIDLQ